MSSTHEAFSLPTSSPGLSHHHPDAFDPSAITQLHSAAAAASYSYPPPSPGGIYDSVPTTFVPYPSSYIPTKYKSANHLSILQLTFTTIHSPSSAQHPSFPILPSFVTYLGPSPYLAFQRIPRTWRYPQFRYSPSRPRSNRDGIRVRSPRSGSRIVPLRRRSRA